MLNGRMWILCFGSNLTDECELLVSMSPRGGLWLEGWLSHPLRAGRCADAGWKVGLARDGQGRESCFQLARYGLWI
jgi:hypothetical protein